MVNHLINHLVKCVQRALSVYTCSPSAVHWWWANPKSHVWCRLMAERL